MNKFASGNIDLNIATKKGKEFIARRDYELAIKQFEGIIAAFPESKQAHFELGKTYYLQNKSPLALKELLEAKRISPDDADSSLLLAKIYKATGRYESAFEEIKPLLNNSLFVNEASKEFSGIYPTYIQQLKARNFNGDYERVAEKLTGLHGFIPEADIFSCNKSLSELEIAQKKLILSSKMRNLIVTLSTRCNLNCTMCEEIRTHWEIPKKTLREIISFFPYLERIVWQGGEAFFYPDFGRLLDEASGFHNVRQVITTNGLLIDEKWAEKLVKSNVDLTFSIDGVTKDIYENIRRGAKFEVLIRNLCNFNKLRKQYSPLINTNLHLVVMKSNYHQLERFIDFAKEYGFKLLALLPIGGNFESPENIFHFKDKEALEFIKEVIPKIRKKAEEYGILLENRLPIDINELGLNTSNCNLRDGTPCFNNKMLCHLPWIQLYIDYDGSIRPDCVCKPEENVGNVQKNTLEEVWNNQKMQLYRKKIIDNCCNEICNSECTNGQVSERYLKFS